MFRISGRDDVGGANGPPGPGGTGSRGAVNGSRPGFDEPIGVMAALLLVAVRSGLGGSMRGGPTGVESGCSGTMLPELPPDAGITGGPLGGAIGVTGAAAGG